MARTSVEVKFEELKRAYQLTIYTTVGCGERGQFYVDNAYEKMKNFAIKHNLPVVIMPCHQVDDDGKGGLSGFSRPFGH